MLRFHCIHRIFGLTSLFAMSNVLSGCFAYAIGVDDYPDIPPTIGMDQPARPVLPEGLCEMGQVTRCQTRCAEGNAASCNNLGAMYELGEGVSRDTRHALRLYDRACTAGAAAACVNLTRLRPDPPVRVVQPAPAPAATDDDDDLYSVLDR